MTSRAFLTSCFLTLGGWIVAVSYVFLSLISAPVMAQDGHAGVAASKLDVRDVWARATPTGAKVAAAYFTVTAETDDVLLRAESGVAGRAELHQTTMDVNGALQMRELAAGIDLPAGQAVTLAPAGTHIMLMALKAPLEEGYEFPLTLYFKNAGMKNVRAAIKPVSYMPGMGADSMPHEGHSGHEHHGH